MLIRGNARNLRRVDGGRKWTPARLFAAGEPGAWYDPSDFSTLFQDSAGTVPVTAVDQQVRRMLDKSGRGNHMIQPVLASAPFLRQNANGTLCLRCDGSNDWMYSAANFNLSSTDKVSIFTGIKKTGSATAIVIEHGTSFVNNTRVFYVVAGTDAVFVNGYTSAARGSGVVSSRQVSSFQNLPPPHTAVISATHNIPGDLSTIRVNGVSGTNGAADKGEGNFGNYVLYIGRRANSSLPFDGDIHGMIIRGALSTASEIASSEKWMNGKTLAY